MWRKFFLCMFPLCSLLANVDSVAIDDNIASISRREDVIPKDTFEGTNDNYLEGYLQAMVHLHYSEYKVIVIVKDGVVWLANLSKNQLIAKSIISFLQDVPGVKEVKIIDGHPPKEVAESAKYINRPIINGIWFPQETELFLPLIASPRQVVYSVGYRFGDKVCGKSAVPVSLGDDFPVFRWLNLFWGGDMQIGIEAGIWSVFDLDPKPAIAPGTALVNTDFFVAIPLSYACNKLSFRLRVYHESSHLGDEYMVDHPNVARLNPSYEAIDFFTSYQATDGLRLYFGPGVIFHSDPTFPMKTGYVQYGAEFRFWGTKFYYQQLYGTWFLAGHLQNWQYQNWNFDGTAVFGYEFSKLQGIGRKMRLFLQFHSGFSWEGQFSTQKTTYGAILLSYGF